jgi:hypothetical protein
MRRGVIFALSIVSAAAQFVTPVPAMMPSRDVLAHFQTLFASAGVPFEPWPAGHGFLIRAAAPECDLATEISRWEPNSDARSIRRPREIRILGAGKYNPRSRPRAPMSLFGSKSSQPARISPPN